MSSEIQLENVMSTMSPIEEDKERESMMTGSELDMVPSAEQLFEQSAVQDDYDTDLEMESKSEEFDLTGRQLYLDACKHLSIVPVSYFIRHMLESSLDLKYHGLSLPGVKAIAIALESNTVVLTLNLEGNHIGGAGGAHIARMLKENIYITEANLASNNLGTAGAMHICDMLANNTTLQVLNLSSNKFTDADAIHFVDALIENRRLQTLDLSHNKFGQKAAFLLGPAIAENDTLEELDLSWNCFRTRGAVEICDSIKNNARLKRVNLAFNGLGLAGGLAVAGIIKGNNLLLDLDVSDNRIPFAAVAAISKSLLVNDAMKIFRIANNPLTPEGVTEMLKGISVDTSVIETLDMSGIEVDKAFLAAKNEYLENRNNVEIIHGRTLSDYVIKGPPKTKLRILIDTNPSDVEVGSILATIKEHCLDKKIHIKEHLLENDKNNDNKIPIADFIVAMQMAGISLMDDQVTKLTNILQKLETPEIDYGIFLKN